MSLQEPALVAENELGSTTAGEEVAPSAMTGLAVPDEPITGSAKAVEELDSSAAENRAVTVAGLPSIATPEVEVDPQSEPADVTMEHAVSVEAPTSDVRVEHEPVQNPADKPEVSDAVVETTASESADPLFDDVSDVAPVPQSPISQSDAVQKPITNETEIKEESNAPHGPTPPESGDVSPLASVASQSGSKDEAMPDVPVGTTKPKHDRSEDHPQEPSSKRARTDEGSNEPTPAVKFAEPDPARKMTPNRQKYCLVVLRQLKKSKDSAPFLQPVDPVRLKIPDYFKIVTDPQDLGTIETQLKKGAYSTIDEFTDSVQLVWANCQKYNGSESAINLMALRLKEQFERQIRSMPTAEPVEVKASPMPKGQKGKKPGKAAGTPVAAARARKMSSPAAPGGVPAIRRESTGLDGRPKREIHAPPPKSLPYQIAPQKRGKNVAQLKFCGQVLKELTHKRHEKFAFPFYQPVDAQALGLHDYHTIIRHPMDLATMQSKINAGEYESADDFEYDVRLMFRNCYKYNPSDSPVNAMGKRLENVFNEKWAEKPIPKPEGYGSDSDDESDVDDSSKQTVEMLTKQLEAMKNQIASINSQKKKKKKPKKERFEEDDGGMGPRDRDYRIGGKKGANKKNKDSYEEADESPMMPTFEQKTALSTKMGYMTEHQMPVVIQILKRTDPNFDPEDEEVELDVDKVHPKTIRLLWNWIMDDIQPSFMRKKAPKAKKNRNVLSETEQQRQIEQLEAQLHKFDGNDAYGHVSRYGNIPNDDSSGSDSDASSEEDD